MMRVVVLEESSEDMMFNSLQIVINDNIKFAVHSSEDSPEDNTLHRNFSDCYDIPALLRKAYEAGKNGEDFTVEYAEDGE